MKIIDHGWWSPDYFPGCGVVGTQYDHVVTGCGTSYMKALDDAMEQAAQLGFEIDAYFGAGRPDYQGVNSEPWPDELRYVSVLF
jgi:hypothetical protein